MAIAALIMWVESRLDAPRVEAWERFANANGLKVDRDVHSGGMPKVVGNYRGRELELCYEDTNIHWTMITLSLETPLESWLGLGFRDVLNRLGKDLFGAEELEFGHKILDQDYWLKSSNHALPGKVLGKKTRAGLLRFVRDQERWEFHWKEDKAQAIRTDHMKPLPDSPQRLKLVADILSEVAQGLEEAEALKVRTEETIKYQQPQPSSTERT